MLLRNAKKTLRALCVELQDVEAERREPIAGAALDEVRASGEGDRAAE
jgi:hypothetical protein